MRGVGFDPKPTAILDESEMTKKDADWSIVDSNSKEMTEIVNQNGKQHGKITHQKILRWKIKTKICNKRKTNNNIIDMIYFNLKYCFYYIYNYWKNIYLF